MYETIMQIPLQTNSTHYWVNYFAWIFNVVMWGGGGALVTIQRRKITQFYKGMVQLPFPLMQGSPLCPVTANQGAVSSINLSLLPSHAFLWQDLISLGYRLYKVFTSSKFM